jgi:hypothetical protein
MTDRTPSTAHDFVDITGRNLCDICDQWAGSPRHRVRADEHIHRDAVLAAIDAAPAVGLDVERLARALRAWRGDYGLPVAVDLPDAAELARLYAEAEVPSQRTFDELVRIPPARDAAQEPSE